MINVDWLKGTKILLIAHYVPGPMAAYLLRCMGARIIKVEPPFYDHMRQLPPFLKSSDGKMSAYFRALNAGFESIAIDFKSEKGVKILKDLIKDCDVLIDGNRAGYLQKILNSEISDINSEIIHIPITAYGLTGPRKDIAGHDNNVLALAGNLSFTQYTQRGTPSIFSAQLADISSGYIAALMAVTSLFGKKNKNSLVDVKTIDVSMFHSAFFLNQIYFAAMNVSKEPPQSEKELLNGGLANYTTYLTMDEKSIFFGPIETNLFKNFLVKIDRLDLLDLLNKDNQELYYELVAIFRSKRIKDWEQILEGVDCCYTKINDLKEAALEPQAKALNLLKTVKDEKYGDLKLTGFPAGFTNESLPPKFDSKAPEPGEHTKEILSGLGYKQEIIEELYLEKIIK